MLFASLPLVLVFIASTLLRVVQAGEAFAGCIPEFGVPKYSASYKGLKNSIQACRDSCSSSDLYMYYNSRQRECYCDRNNGPERLGRGSADDCIHFTVNILGTTFSGACSEQAIIDPRDRDLPTRKVTSTAQCIHFCARYEYAVYEPYSGPSANCRCGRYPVRYSSSACRRDNTFYVFNQPPPPTAAPRARARRLDAELARLAQEHPECPPGRTACPVEGGGYECIDTDTELESCGGCRVPGSSAPAGIDCTALPGVHPHAVTCTRGRCVTFRCKPGFTLRKGKCVAYTHRTLVDLKV